MDNAANNGRNTPAAMGYVSLCLDNGNVEDAQEAVMLIEVEGSILPESMFRRVFAAALNAECLTGDYAQFMLRHYGQKGYVDLVYEILPALRADAHVRRALRRPG